MTVDVTVDRRVVRTAAATAERQRRAAVRTAGDIAQRATHLPMGALVALVATLLEEADRRAGREGKHS